jgi:hypothetical protein
MARPDRQRKKSSTPRRKGGLDPYGNPVDDTPKVNPFEKNPLDVPQFLDPSKKFDPQKDINRSRQEIDKQKKETDLRKRLAAKTQQRRMGGAMRDANARRGRRTGTRVFRDPANLQQFLQSNQGQPTTQARGNQQQGVDDTIVQGADGQHFRYDSEIDGFTPVSFDPAKNQFVFAGDTPAAKAKDEASGTAFKEGQQAFEKQLSDLRGMADQDPQFGKMFRELQGEYMALMRDPNLREEERQAAMTDLFDRGMGTFEATSGFRRAQDQMAEEQKRQKAQQEQADDMAYRNRKAAEVRDENRRQMAEARKDRATRQNYSQTTQDIDKAYEAYKSNFSDVQQAMGDKPVSMEEFADSYYKRIHEDEEINNRIQEIDFDISNIETEIGQLEDEDDLRYRNQLTEIYGAGRQDDADAAFERHKMMKSAQMMKLRQQLAVKKEERTAMRLTPTVREQAYRNPVDDRDAEGREVIGSAADNRENALRMMQRDRDMQDSGELSSRGDDQNLMRVARSQDQGGGIRGKLDSAGASGGFVQGVISREAQGKASTPQQKRQALDQIKKYLRTQDPSKYLDEKTADYFAQKTYDEALKFEQGLDREDIGTGSG